MYQKPWIRSFVEQIFDERLCNAVFLYWAWLGHPEYQSAYRTRCDTSDNVCLMTTLFYIYYVAKKTSIDLILNLLYIHPLYRKLVYLYFFSQPCEGQIIFASFRLLYFFYKIWRQN
jgi:hypothetical protein